MVEREGGVRSCLTTMVVRFMNAFDHKHQPCKFTFRTCKNMEETGLL